MSTVYRPMTRPLTPREAQALFHAVKASIVSRCTVNKE